MKLILTLLIFCISYTQFAFAQMTSRGGESFNVRVVDINNKNYYAFTYCLSKKECRDIGENILYSEDEIFSYEMLATFQEVIDESQAILYFDKTFFSKNSIQIVGKITNSSLGQLLALAIKKPDQIVRIDELNSLEKDEQAKKIRNLFLNGNLIEFRNKSYFEKFVNLFEINLKNFEY